METGGRDVKGLIRAAGERFGMVFAPERRSCGVKRLGPEGQVSSWNHKS